MSVCMSVSLFVALASPMVTSVPFYFRFCLYLHLYRYLNLTQRD